MSESEQLTWYIALGEQRGGTWDYKKMEWSDPPKPMPVFAIAAEMK